MLAGSACLVRHFDVIGLWRHALHLLDDQVHPDEGCTGDDRHEDEGRRDQTRPLLDVGEQRGQEEAAKAAEHSDETADRADVVGEVGGDVLVDGGLANAHRAADEEDDEDDERERQAEGLTGFGVDARGEHEDREEGADRHEGDVHRDAGSPLIGDPSAEGAQQGCGEDEGRRQQARTRQGDAEIINVERRKDRGERDVSAENDDVVEAEPPHADVFERFEHRRKLDGSCGLAILRRSDEPQEDDEDDEEGRVDDGDEAPTALDAEDVGGTGGGRDDPRSNELSDRSSDIARTENAEGEALTTIGEPRGVPGDTRGEGVTDDADAEGEDEEHRVVAGRDEGDADGGDGAEDHHDGHDDLPAETVGEDTGGEAPHGSVEDGDCTDPGELNGVEAELLLDRLAEDTEHQPHRKHQGEGDGGHGEDPIGPRGFAMRSAV